MQRSMAILAIAVTCGASLAMAGSADKDVTGTATVTQKHLATGGLKIDQELAAVEKQALITKNMPGLISLFNQESQQRIHESKDFSKDFGGQLDGQIEQLSRNWQKKYGHTLMAKNPSEVFGSTFASIDTGSAKHDARLASEVEREGGLNSKEVASDDAIAVASVRATKNLPPVQVPLVCEKGGHWQLAAPTSLTADQLRQNLLTQIRTINEEQASWPASEMEAQRMVTHRVLLAIYGGSTVASNHTAGAIPTVAGAKSLPAQTAKATPVTTTSGTAHHWWQFWRRW